MNEITRPGAPQPSRAVSPPSKASFKPLKECTTLNEAFETREIKDRIADAIPRHMDPTTMLRTFVQAASKTPLIYQCDLRQALGAFLSLSYLGLTPGTALGLAHLIPFKSKRWNRETRKSEDCVDLNVIIGYPGYVELAHRSGLVRSIHADIVLPGEHFRAEHGSHKVLEHRPELDHDTDGLVPRAAYAFINMAEEGDQFEVMPWGDVLKIRNRSQAFRTALAAKEEAEANGKRAPRTWLEAPWVRDEREMGKKTPFRRAAKWLPKCPELRAGVALEEAQDRGRLNYGSVIDGTASPLDGIPEAEDDPPPVDPGTAHGIRSGAGTQESKAANAQQQQTRGANEPPNDGRFAPPQGDPVDKAPAQSKPKNAPSRQPAPTFTFEAVLIDANGEVASEPFTEPAAFARAFMSLWNASGNQGEALREYNEGALSEAAEDPTAQAILAQMDETDEEGSAEDGGEVRQNVEPEIVAVEPPMERGRLSWSGYVKLIKQALTTLTAAQFPAWATAQRDALAKAPLAQRVLAIRAIGEAAGLLRVAQPPWLGELIKPGDKPPPASVKQDEPVPDNGVVKSSDERWVEARLGELAEMNDRDRFDQLVGSGAVRTVMARLRRENRALFDRADAAFTAKHHALHPDAGGEDA